MRLHGEGMGKEEGSEKCPPHNPHSLSSASTTSPPPAHNHKNLKRLTHLKFIVLFCDFVSKKTFNERHSLDSDNYIYVKAIAAEKRMGRIVCIYLYSTLVASGPVHMAAQWKVSIAIRY